MARSKLRRPNQSLLVRSLLSLFEFCASLKLAVILILSSAATLGVATFVEAEFGLEAVHFGIYGAAWFALLQAMLAVNIACAALIRYPWKRHQTGFVITHIGLLTLLFGCWLTWQGGIDAQIPIFEGKLGNTAFDKSGQEFLEVVIQPARAAADAERVVHRVPMTGGPFNWSDYGTERSWFPWGRQPPSRGLLFDQDGIRIEAIDFFSDSEELPAPQVTLELSAPRAPRAAPDGTEDRGPRQWMPVKLAVTPSRARLGTREWGVGEVQSVGGGQLGFWMVGSPAAKEAFVGSAPDNPVGEKGQIVLHAQGKRFALRVDELESAGRLPLEGTDLAIELADYLPTATFKQDAAPGRFELMAVPGQTDPKQPAVQLNLYRATATDDEKEDEEANTPASDEPVGRLVLLAELPQLNVDAADLEVYGTYWFDYGEKSTEELLRGEGSSRIDVVQAPDEKLYYRYWNRREVVAAGELPASGEPVDAFQMPIDQLQLRLARHIPAERPTRVVLPLEFEKDPQTRDKQRAVQLRMTVDDRSDEFWLVQVPPDALDWFPSQYHRHLTPGDDRLVSISLQQKQYPFGFQVRLKEFDRKLDPGTSQASHYGSRVDIVDSGGDETLAGDQHISMNAPIDFTDPVSGRSYRLFQESFRGPYKPGDFIFDSIVADPAARPKLYLSVLTVNYDPGRGIKYIGCLLIVAGIVTMFYMRAYFFKPKQSTAGAAA